MRKLEKNVGENDVNVSIILTNVVHCLESNVNCRKQQLEAVYFVFGFLDCEKTDF